LWYASTQRSLAGRGLAESRPEHAAKKYLIDVSDIYGCIVQGSAHGDGA
jgi:hypothetical protein